MNLALPELRAQPSQTCDSAPHLEASYASQPGRAVKGIKSKREGGRVDTREVSGRLSSFYFFFPPHYTFFCGDWISKWKPHSSRTGKSGAIWCRNREENWPLTTDTCSFGKINRKDFSLFSPSVVWFSTPWMNTAGSHSAKLGSHWPHVTLKQFTLQFNFQPCW